MNTGYELRFKTETKKRPLCEKILTREEVVKVKLPLKIKLCTGYTLITFTSKCKLEKRVQPPTILCIIFSITWTFISFNGPFGLREKEGE